MPSGVSRVLDLRAEISGGRNRPNVVGVCASIVRTRVGLVASRPTPELLADTCEREGPEPHAADLLRGDRHSGARGPFRGTDPTRTRGAIAESM